MAMDMSPPAMMKAEILVESSIMPDKILVGLLFAIPIGAAVYLWKRTCDLHQRIRTLKSEDEDCIMSIGCQLCKRNKTFKDNETITESLPSQEKNILFLKNALDETNVTIENLTENIRCLEERVLTIQRESNAIHKRIYKLQKCHF